MASTAPHTLPAFHVLPFDVTAPADLTHTADGKASVLRVEMYHAYVFIPDREIGVRLEGIELPGKALEPIGGRPLLEHCLRRLVAASVARVEVS
jgi:hypothetical protein